MFAGHHLCAKGACGTTDYEQRNYNLRVKRTGGAFFSRTGSCVGNKRIAVGFFFESSAISALQLFEEVETFAHCFSSLSKFLPSQDRFEIIVCTISYIFGFGN